MLVDEGQLVERMVWRTELLGQPFGECRLPCALDADDVDLHVPGD
jgi:hypothetical protein